MSGPPRNIDEWAVQVSAGLDPTQHQAFEDWLRAARARTQDWKAIAQAWEQFAGGEQHVVIGSHIQWKDIERQVFRVAAFTATASVDNAGNVSTSGMVPYGLATVESPVLTFPAQMPVVHRVNFLQLRYLHELIGYTPKFLDGAGWELLIAYAPAGFLLRVAMPPLHLRLAPHGTLETFYEAESHWRPPGKAEDLFGKLAYHNLPMDKEVEILLGRQKGSPHSIWTVQIAPDGVRTGQIPGLS